MYVKVSFYNQVKTNHFVQAKSFTQLNIDEQNLPWEFSKYILYLFLI